MKHKSLISLIIFLSASGWAGILPTSRGGTGANLIPAAGGIISSSSSGFVVVPAGSTNALLQSNGTLTPSFVTNITLAAGTTVAGGAPLVIPAGSVLATPVSGAIESNGTNLSWTDSAAKRWTIQRGSTVYTSPAGTAGAGGALMVLTAGSTLSTPVNGSIESNGTHLWWTDSTGARHLLDNSGAP